MNEKEYGEKVQNTRNKMYDALTALGDKFVQQLGYQDATGIAAVRRYLMERYEMPLDMVNGMTLDQIAFMIANPPPEDAKNVQPPVRVQTPVTLNAPKGPKAVVKHKK